METKRLTDVYYDMQDLRIRTANRLRQLPQKTVQVYPDELKKLELQIKKQVEELLQHQPIYTEWLKKIKGISTCLGGGLISCINVKFVTVPNLKKATELQTKYAMKTKDKETGKAAFLVPEVRGIAAFATVSKLWAYCGMNVTEEGKAPRRQKGQTVTWSPKMRVLCWKIGKSFIMTGDFYQDLYKQIKEQYLKTHKHILKEKGGKGHIDAMARRKTVKIFLEHLWVTWRKMLDLPVTKPYALQLDPHSHYIEPPTFEED